MNVIRFLIILATLTFLSYLVQNGVYGSEYYLDWISDSLFVVGIVFFFPSLIVQTGSYEVFYGMRYAVNAFFVKNFRKHYQSYAVYKQEKDIVITTTFFKELLIASLILIICGGYLGWLHLNG